MATTAARDQGKTAFLKEFLLDNPTANPVAANKAWVAAGMEGSVSASLVNKLRSQLKLTGNLRAGRKSKSAVATRRPLEFSRSGARVADRDLATFEAEIDRLIYRLMSVDGLDDVANKLREGRRALYAHYHRAGV